MILIDANLLIYAYAKSDVRHKKARTWLEDCLNDSSRVGLPWLSLLAFLRLTTNRRIATKAVSMPEALAQVHSWLSSPRVWIPEPTDTHATTFAKLVSLPGLTFNDVNDCYLAALAIDHGLTLCSADVGFGRFPGLRWQNPLAV